MHFKAEAFIQHLKLNKKISIIVQIQRLHKSQDGKIET